MSGNVNEVARIIISATRKDIDLDRALRLSAGLGKLDVAKLLIEHGATDLDGALCRAAEANQMCTVRWLVSTDREHPATDLASAIQSAGNACAVEAEFFLFGVQRGYAKP
jgi:hypothetical protein